ncbi:MAG: acyl-CoA thioesterase [Candidatus Azobacteroides sp.]|nr:acyl-CoA thioesterase [Candidatus Azobacteroides sp.]
MREYFFEFLMKVRDYECDMQGIVNNAIYLHYLEYTRHEFLESIGVSFAGLQTLKIDPVVSRIEIDYKAPLRSGDCFISKMKMIKTGIKYIFFHEIYKNPDQRLSVKAKVEVVILENGRLSRGGYFDEILQKIGA